MRDRECESPSRHRIPAPTAWKGRRSAPARRVPPSRQAARVGNESSASRFDARSHPRTGPKNRAAAVALNSRCGNRRRLPFHALVFGLPAAAFRVPAFLRGRRRGRARVHDAGDDRGMADGHADAVSVDGGVGADREHAAVASLRPGRGRARRHRRSPPRHPRDPVRARRGDGSARYGGAHGSGRADRAPRLHVSHRRGLRLLSAGAAGGDQRPRGACGVAPCRRARRGRVQRGACRRAGVGRRDRRMAGNGKRVAGGGGVLCRDDRRGDSTAQDGARDPRRAGDDPVRRSCRPALHTPLGADARAHHPQPLLQPLRERAMGVAAARGARPARARRGRLRHAGGLLWRGSRGRGADDPAAAAAHVAQCRRDVGRRVVVTRGIAHRRRPPRLRSRSSARAAPARRGSRCLRACRPQRKARRRHGCVPVRSRPTS